MLGSCLKRRSSRSHAVSGNVTAGHLPCQKPKKKKILDFLHSSFRWLKSHRTNRRLWFSRTLQTLLEAYVGPQNVRLPFGEVDGKQPQPWKLIKGAEQAGSKMAVLPVLFVPDEETADNQVHVYEQGTLSSLTW